MNIEELSPSLVDSLDPSVEINITLEDSQTLSHAIIQLLDRPNPFESLQNNPAEKEHLDQLLKVVVERFEGPANPDMAFELHKSLNTIYDYQINAFAKAPQYDPTLMEVMAKLESAWLAFEKKRMPQEDIPTEPKAFSKWLKQYVLKHPSSNHPLFQYLADESKKEEMSYFFSQEVTIDPRFDDLIALMQVGIKTPGIKMELASNFWDEMGNGVPEDVHTELFSRLYSELDIYRDGETFADVLERASWQALACGNTLLYSVLHRKNLNIGLGALGTVEIISPFRFSHLVRGFKRSGLSDEASEYHQTHISIDARHGNGWLTNAIRPTVAQSVEAREEVFFGSMLRMNTSMDYCEHMAKTFALDINK